MIDRVSAAETYLEEERVLQDRRTIREPHRDRIAFGIIRDVITETIRKGTDLRHTVGRSGERNDDLMLLLALGALQIEPLLLGAEEPKRQRRVGRYLRHDRLIGVGKGLTDRQTIIATDIIHRIEAVDSFLHIPDPESPDRVRPTDTVKRQSGESRVLEVGIDTYRDAL